MVSNVISLTIVIHRQRKVDLSIKLYEPTSTCKHGMAKKKKTQLKPVARGFATTSVPKKAAQSDEIDSTIEPELPPSDRSGTGSSQAHERQASNPRAIAQDTTQDVCHASQDEKLLQNILDKYQEKTEKEISKTIKVGSFFKASNAGFPCSHSWQAIEVDRRNSRTFFHLPINPIFVDLVFQLYLEEEEQKGAIYALIQVPST